MTFAARPLGLSAIGAGWFSADQVSALLHFNGANNGTTFADDTGLNTWTRSGAVTTTAQKSLGTASGYFNNNAAAQYIRAAANARFDLLGGDFTIALRTYHLTFTGARRAVQIGGGNSWGNASGSTVLTVGFTTGAPNTGYAPYLGLSNASASPVLHYVSTGNNISTSQWDAWCWAVKPTGAKLYRNGDEVYSGSHSGLANPAGVTFGCTVGSSMAGSPANTDGIRAYIDELVIVKGWAGDLSGMTSEIVL